jgi:hypothetical protein
MDPRLEKKLADPNSMFAKNPAFKRGAADVQKLYSDSFNELVEKVRNVVGKDDLTPNELASVISSTMMRNVQAIQQIEQSNSDELVELAIEGTLNEMEISINENNNNNIDTTNNNNDKIKNLALEYWSIDSKKGFNESIIKKIYIEEICKGHSQYLEFSGYLENFLWKYFNEKSFLFCL